MLNNATSYNENQLRRAKAKSLDGKMKTVAIEGAGLTPWEADVLVDSIQEVYFADADLASARDGQLRWTCVSASEGAGKPIKQCKLVSVILSLVSPSDRDLGKIPIDQKRKVKIMRITEEAREQGGLLSQEDLAEILCGDVRTVRRDVADLRKLGIVVATRGQQKDIGPGVSHKGIAIRHWLEGKEVVEVARVIHHSVYAVERYIEVFKRVAYLLSKNFAVIEIARIVGISDAGAKTFCAIADQFKNKPFYLRRIDEIALISEVYKLDDCQKKARTAKRNGRTP